MGYSSLQLELINHLKEQCEFLATSGNLFDKGSLNEGKRIATQIRTIVHQTKNSSSLLLQMKESFGIQIKILSKTHSKLIDGAIFWASITIQFNKEGARYIPMLDLNHPALNEVNIKDWWDDVLIIINGEDYTRKDIILGLVNKDGGAHIDPDMKHKYNKLTREIKVFESSGQIDLGKFELTIARESGFYLLLALKKYFEYLLQYE